MRCASGDMAKFHVTTVDYDDKPVQHARPRAAGLPPI